MRIHFLLFSLFWCFLVTAQQVMVPFRSGTVWGLSDEKGKIVVKPQYEKMEYISGKYFRFSRTLPGNDTVQIGKNQYQIFKEPYKVHGLYHQSTLLIRGQLYPEFLIYPQLIIASENPYHPENCELYNLKGEKLLEGPIKGIGVNDERDFGDLVNISKHFTLLMLFERDVQRNRVYSIVLYDNAKQRISKWLLTKVRDLRIQKGASGPSYSSFTYSEAGLEKQIVLRFTGNGFELQKVNNRSGIGLSQSGPEDNLTINGPGDDLKVPEMKANMETIPMVNETVSDEVLEQRGSNYYLRRPDSLFYQRGQNKQWVNVPEGTTIIYPSKNTVTHFGSLLFRNSNRFGLLVGGEFKEALYDSIYYFGNQFLAGSLIKGHLKYGIIGRSGEQVLPQVYDSIQGERKSLRWQHLPGRPGSEYSIGLSTDDEYYGTKKSEWPHVKKRTSYMLVFQEGRLGLMDRQYRMIIPVEYEMIANNGFNFGNPKITEYVLLKKEGRYGLTEIRYNYVSKNYEMVNTLKPVFVYIPCYYFKDYYGVKDFNLYALYDQSFRFLEYADNKGKLFSEE